MRLLAAPDKFRGTISATEAAAAIAAGAEAAGWEARRLPLADGGEGTLAAFGGPNRSARVTGPLHAPLDAAWRLDGTRAVIEMATASGLALVGGRDHNDPIGASTRGTGELLGKAIDGGATQIIVGVGGSAATDGGLGAYEALGGTPFPRGVRVRVACDVTTTFVDAARLFGPQKGADEDQVMLLQQRLRSIASRYESELGIDVRGLPHSGAAGGLAGGLAALGAELVPGFDLIADTLGVDDAIADAELVVTGEGALDAMSFHGKVVGGIEERSRRHGVRVLAVAGSIDGELPAGLDADSFEALSLTATFGSERAWNDTAACISEAISRRLNGASAR